MRKYYKAPAFFVKLYSEGDEAKEEVLEYISEIVGYGVHWVKANLPKAFDLLHDNQKEAAQQKFDRTEIIKKYAWSRYYYENWDKVKDTIGLPFTTVNYDKKKGKIVVVTESAIKQKIKKFGEQLKKLLEIREAKKDQDPF